MSIPCGILIDCNYNYIATNFSHSYLVEQQWLKQWKKYTGFDSFDQHHAGSETVCPGPVNNSNLFEGTLYIERNIKYEQRY